MTKKGTRQIHKCPDCNSENISYEDTDFIKDGLKQDVECMDCSAEWVEHFKFVSWELK